MSKKAIIVIIIVLLIGGAGWYFMSDRAKENGENVDDEEVIVEEERKAEEEVNEEDNEEEVPLEEEEPTNLYEEAEEVTPTTDRNVELDQDMREIFAEFDFEEEPKLISTGDVTAATYIAERPLTEEDAEKAYDKFEDMEKYEIDETASSSEKYEINVSGEVGEKEYDGDVYINFWLTEEGEKNSQMTIVKIL